MINDFTPLNPSFVEGLTPDEVDEVFIARMLWADDDDFMTAYNISWYFLQYPGLGTLEKVDHKTYECIGKMMKQDLITCRTLGDDNVSFDKLNQHKDMIYRVMKNECEPEEMYQFLFSFTNKRKEFLYKNLPKYQPIIDEICRLYHQDITTTQEK